MLSSLTSTSRAFRDALSGATAPSTLRSSLLDSANGFGGGAAQRDAPPSAPASADMPDSSFVSLRRAAAFVTFSALACTDPSRPPAFGEWASSTASGTALVVILEPGVCLGCSQWPRQLDRLKRCAEGSVTHVWRRKPTKIEERQAIPLRLDIKGHLDRPFPSTAPSGPVYVLYSKREIVGTAQSHEVLAADSLVAQAILLEQSVCRDLPPVASFSAANP